MHVLVVGAIPQEMYEEILGRNSLQLVPSASDAEGVASIVRACHLDKAFLARDASQEVEGLLREAQVPVHRFSV